MSKKSSKSCLVVSYGPVPTSEYQTIEGGGMRVWGLAQGLLAQGFEVTVAINASFPQKLKNHAGIMLTNWATDVNFIHLMNAFDAVIVSYCMGSDSVFIAENIHDDIQLVLDLYVPIYVEVSARDSKDIDAEYKNYAADVQRFNSVLKRGDYFLCASNIQKTFYTGVLGALGIINPRSYREKRLLIVPFGLHDESIESSENPYLKLGISESDFTVLWFGGLYPWFRVEELLQAIQTLSSNKKIKFVIVGGKNPYNTNPDFLKQYTYAYSFAEKNALLNKSLFFVDWVDYEKRINWFVNADLVISLNNPGEENGFSWRTRVMDFVWGEAPILTNGEDVLSEELLADQAAVKLTELTARAISDSIKTLANNPDLLANVKSELRTVKSKYFWPEIILPAARVIEEGVRPSVLEKAYRNSLGMTESDTMNANLSGFNKKIDLAKRGIRYVKKHGVRKASSLVKRRLEGRIPLVNNSKDKKYIFISHPIDNTGAPLVLLQMIDEAVNTHGAENVLVVAPHIDAHHLRTLRTLGVHIEISQPLATEALIRSQLQLRKDDFVLLSTLAVPFPYQRYIFEALLTGHLKHAGWFIHEDQSQLVPIKSLLLEDTFKSQAVKLLIDKRLSVFVPAERVRKDYDKFFGIRAVKTIPYRVDVPERYKAKRTQKDYQNLNFLLSGTATDGRKGQFIAISAFSLFKIKFYDEKPSQYRDFTLTLVAIGGDFISQQIRSLGSSLLTDKNFTIHPPVSRVEALKITQECNAVICCSLNETFGLYVGEGMFMGHVVLRNNSAGMEEQLREGENGYYINDKDVNQFAEVIEKLLNRKTTSDTDLQKMGAFSQGIIAPFANNTYLANIEGAK